MTVLQISLIGFLAPIPALAQLIAPCTPDPNTLHLWHLDESSAPAQDSINGGLVLQGLLDGATLGSDSLPGFGSALDTDAEASTGALLLAASALANGAGDDVPFSHADPATGAFTFEAVIRFDSSYDHLAQPADPARLMQILSMDNDTSHNRVFQFRYEGRTATTDPRLAFINIGSDVTRVSASVPLVGDDAVNSTDWFHVAVTYDGNPAAIDNTKLYWTRLRPTTKQARLLTTGSMAKDLLVTAADFAIGNEARDGVGGSTNGFPGRIDEVRVSRIARAIGDMIPSNEDSDMDGMGDAWERSHFGDLDGQTEQDPDLDGADNRAEYLRGSDPNVFDDDDSDDDGLPDPWELAQFGNLDQNEASDYDRDGASEMQELDDGSDPSNPNSVAGDLDGDSLLDEWELLYFPTLTDTAAYEDPDEDGSLNVAELVAGTDPNDPSSKPSWKAPRVALLQDSVVTTDACLMPTGSPFGRKINGVSFQSEILLSCDGYQYTAWYDTVDSVETIWLARRTFAGASVGPWEKFNTGSEFTRGDEGSWDAHNIISLGAAPDGTLHMIYDHHVHDLRYRYSVPGLCTSNKAAWGTDDMMKPEQDWLVSAETTITGLTYPMFFNRPDGGLFATYRVGSHVSGDHYLHEYDGSTGSWSPGWKVTSKAGTFTGLLFSGYGSSPSRNPYENGWDFGADGVLHHTWTCREQVGATNHDIFYAYSADDGRTWRNNDGAVIADTGAGESISVNSPGVVVKVLDCHQLLINQQAQCVDNDGRVHVMMWHRRAEPGFEWQPGDDRFFGSETAYYHYFRDPLTGEWSQRRIPPELYAVGARPKIGYDATGNVYAVFATDHPTSGNQALVVASASLESRYSDWEVVQVADLDFDGEPLLDQTRLVDDGILSVFLQESGPDSEVAIQTPLHVLEFVVNVPDPGAGFQASIKVLGEDVVVSVPATTDSGYQLQRSLNPIAEDWLNIGPMVPGVNGLLALPDPGGTPLRKAFYRVIRRPKS